MKLVGMTPTGRRVTGPAADLVELDSEKGLKHTAVVFHAEWRDHASLGSPLQSVLPFLEDPGVGGILPLVQHSQEEGAFVYATGTVVSLAEVFRVYAEMGQAAGVKAGLELCFLAAETLIEAGAIAAKQTRLRSHGALSPWRIALRADGQVAILGYGIPQVELANYGRDQGRGAKEDSLRYAPPERFESGKEDPSGDLYSLVLIAAEMMVGRPVYDGVLADVRQKAIRGEAVRQLYQWRDKLPDSVREVLVRALKPDLDSRYRDPAEFVFAVHDLLASSDAEGPALVDVARKARLVIKQGRAVLGGSTGDMSAEELAELALSVDGDPNAVGLPSSRLKRPEPDAQVDDADLPRWSKVSRVGRDPDLVRTTDLSGPATDLRERLRQASRRTTEPAPVAAAPPSEESARDRLRRRLKEKGGADAEPEPVKPVPSSVSRSMVTASVAAAPQIPAQSPASRITATRTSAPPAQPSPPIAQPSPPISQPSRPIAPPPVAFASVQALDEPPPAAPSIDPQVQEIAATIEPVRRVPVAAAPPLPKPAAPVPEPPPPVPDAPEPLRPALAAPILPPEGTHGPRHPSSPTAPPATAAESHPVDSHAAALALLDRLRKAAPPRPKLPDPAMTSAMPRPGASAPKEHRLDLLVEGAVRSAAVPPESTLAEAAARIATDAGLPTDLTGALEGWWRLEQDGRRWPGTEGVGVLDPQRPVNLAFVANQVRTMTIEVRGLADPIRFRAPVGTAVPVRSLLEHLRRFLALPPADWILQVDGKALAPLQILDEIDAGDRTTLVVSR